MSPSSQNQPKQTKAQRVAAAREKAKAFREAEAKRRKRNNWLIRGGVVVVALLLVVAIVVISINVARQNTQNIEANKAPSAAGGPVAANVNQYGGVTIGQDGKVLPPETTTTEVSTEGMPTPAPKQGAKPTDLAKMGITDAGKNKPVHVVMYADFMCPICNSFEQKNASVLKQYADQGKVTYEYRLLGLLDKYSAGTHYSTRAASAAMCVADTAPDKYRDYFNKLFKDQPEENSKGLDNSKLISDAKEVGVDISSCVSDKKYWPSVAAFTRQALNDNITGTPTVYVDGQQYNWKTQDFSDFEPALQSAIAAKQS